MTKKITLSAQSEGQALEMASKQVGVDESLLQIKMVKEGKKGLFGKFKELPEFEVNYQVDEKVVSNEVSDNADSGSEEERGVRYYSIEEIPDEKMRQKVESALEYLTEILNSFDIGQIDKSIEFDDKNNLTIKLSGDNVAVIVGRFGEVLDAIQYLIVLSSNQAGGDYMRVILDSGDFRQRRQKTLEELGRRIAKKALRQGRSVALEPMNPYERRIIHASITDVDGVYSKSVGSEPYRKVVVFPENGGKDNRRFNKPRTKRKEYDKDYMPDQNVSNKPSTYDFEKEFLKSSSEKSSDYGKIDLD